MAYLSEPGAPVTATKNIRSIQMLPLMLAMALTILLTLAGVTGVLLYLAKTGGLPFGLGGGLVANGGSGVSTTYAIVLDPLVVNLADADQHGYLRAGVTLRAQNSTESERLAKTAPALTDGKVQAEVSAPLRDIVLDVLGRQKIEDLLQPDGKDKLKVILKKALQDRDPDVKVTDIYFTEFLVQQ
jgi:flagellar FliL protein